MKEIVSGKIEEMLAAFNLTSTEVESSCSSEEGKERREEMTAFLLSYLFTFMDQHTEVGPGDIAAEDFFNKRFLMDEMTDMFNDMTGSSLSSSVFTLPLWFRLKMKSSGANIEVLPPINSINTKGVLNGQQVVVIYCLYLLFTYK